MTDAAVPGFLPSRYGFQFLNNWPSNPARIVNLGRLRIPIGDTGRGLCGGMAFAARDRFERAEPAPLDGAPPPPGTALFKEIVDRQFASFGTLFSVPLRFWLASAGSQAGRTRETIQRAWPEIRADIDAGRPPMVGLIRLAGFNPLALGLGHQVVAYRYAETATQVTMGIYDPNHPGMDTVDVGFEQASSDGGIRMWQSTGESVIGLLHLPWSPARTT
jgi:hypothetical protein